MRARAKVIRGLQLAGLDLFVPIIKLAAGDEPRAQLRALAQSLLLPLPFGDVDEADHGTRQHAVLVTDRCAHVFDRKRRAITPPEHLVVFVVDLPVRERGIDRAFFSVVGIPVGVRVMDDGVLWFPNELLNGPAQDLRSGGVCEGRVALHVQAVDAFAG